MEPPHTSPFNAISITAPAFTCSDVFAVVTLPESSSVCGVAAGVVMGGHTVVPSGLRETSMTVLRTYTGLVYWLDVLSAE